MGVGATGGGVRAAWPRRGLRFAGRGERGRHRMTHGARRSVVMRCSASASGPALRWHAAGRGADVTLAVERGKAAELCCACVAGGAPCIRASTVARGDWPAASCGHHRERAGSSADLSIGAQAAAAVPPRLRTVACLHAPLSNASCLAGPLSACAADTRPRRRSPSARRPRSVKACRRMRTRPTSTRVPHPTASSVSSCATASIPLASPFRSFRRRSTTSCCVSRAARGSRA